MWYAKVVCELLILAQGNRWNCIGKGTHDSVISSEWGPDICAYQHRIGLYLMSYYCCSILSPYCPMFRMFRICRSHSDMYRDTRNILTIYTQYDGGKVVPKLGGNRYSFLSGAAPPLCGCCLPDPLSHEHATRRDGDRQLPSAFMLPARTMSPPIVASERSVTSQVQLGSSSCA
jgi:hypothetical protein